MQQYDMKDFSNDSFKVIVRKGLGYAPTSITINFNIIGVSAPLMVLDFNGLANLKEVVDAAYNRLTDKD